MIVLASRCWVASLPISMEFSLPKRFGEHHCRSHKQTLGYGLGALDIEFIVLPPGTRTSWGCGPVGKETSDGLRHPASRERWIGLRGELLHFSALRLAETSCGSRPEENLLAENVHAQ